MVSAMGIETNTTVGMTATSGLVDREKRHLNYLRISITDRCNLRCLYCAPEGRIPKLDHDAILSYEEILRLVNIGIRLGIRKVRITGGEPLVRKGVIEFLSRLTRIRELEDVSLTTNGVLLASNAQRIFDAGIRRINISLDSLNPKKFAQITGYDKFERVWAGIERARSIGFKPIKINVVAMRGINDDEILNFGRLSLDHPFHIRFIEYMPIGNSRTSSRDQILTPEIQKIIAGIGKLIPVNNDHNDGPAKRYRLADSRGEIGFISALSGPACFPIATSPSRTPFETAVPMISWLIFFAKPCNKKHPNTSFVLKVWQRSKTRCRVSAADKPQPLDDFLIFRLISLQGCLPAYNPLHQKEICDSRFFG